MVRRGVCMWTAGTTTARVRAAAVGGVAAAVAAAIGCGASQEGGPDRSAIVSDVDGASSGLPASAPQSAGGPIDAERRLVPGSSPGLEAHWWLTVDNDHRAAAALARYVDGYSPIDAETAARWRRAGFRVLAAPLGEVRAVQLDLVPTRRWSRKWLGEKREWAEIVRGRRVWEGRPVVFGGRERRLPAGVLRLLTRAWAAPTARGEASLRVELAVQLERARGSASPLARVLGEVDLSPDVWFEGLTLETKLPPTHALVIVAADPAADWPSIAERAGRRGTARGGAEEGAGVLALDWYALRGDAEGGEAAAERGGGAAAGRATTRGLASNDDNDAGGRNEAGLVDVFDEPVERFGPKDREPGGGAIDDGLGLEGAVFGPMTQRVRTLGESMLNAEDPTGNRVRAVLVLIPRVEGGYRLLP